MSTGRHCSGARSDDRRYAGDRVAAAAAAPSLELVSPRKRRVSRWKSAMCVRSGSFLGLAAASVLAVSFLVDAVAAVEVVDSKNAEERDGFATVAGYERQPKVFGLGISDRTTTVSV